MSEAIAHLFGDYVVQSDWMAVTKTQAHGPAAAHAVTYAACFLPVTRNPRALAVIAGTHFVIDRWRLARYVVYAKNQAAPAKWRHRWGPHVSGTGYHRHELVAAEGHAYGEDPCSAQSKPDFMAVWLMIVADNCLHLALNKWAIRRWP